MKDIDFLSFRHLSIMFTIFCDLFLRQKGRFDMAHAKMRHLVGVDANMSFALSLHTYVAQCGAYFMLMCTHVTCVL